MKPYLRTNFTVLPLKEQETDNGVIVIFEDEETHIFDGMPYVLRTVMVYD